MKDPQIGVDSIVEKANNHLNYLIYGVKCVMRDYTLFAAEMRGTIMIKKMISTLCAMIFCLGLLPIAAYAVERGGVTLKAL